MIGLHPTHGRVRHGIACADAWLQSGQRSSISCVRSITVPQGRRKFERYLPEILAAERNGLGPRLRRLTEDAGGGWRNIHQRVQGDNGGLARPVHNEASATRTT